MNRKIIIAALTGAAAGSALGVLFTPFSGKKFRRKIRDRVQDVVNFVIPGNRAQEQEEAAESVQQRPPMPNEVAHPNPKVINPTHVNSKPVNQMVHKNKNALAK